MGNKELIKLDDTLGILDQKIARLRETKSKLDKYKEKIEEVFKKECEFHKLFSLCGIRNEKLSLLFEGSDKVKGLKLIKDGLSEIHSNYIQEQKRFFEDKFSEEILDAYSKEITSFLASIIEQLKELDNKQRSIFDEANKEISEKLSVLNRLLNTLLKKIDELPQELNLKKFVDEKQSQLQSIQGKVPFKLEDIDILNENSIKGAFAEVKNYISTCREEIRRFAIENGLLSENEATLLETIYEVLGKEFEFMESVSKLKERLSFDEKIIQDLMLELSKKGFIILKVITE